MNYNCSATLDTSAWKQHTCASCGSTFAYVMTRRGAGYGATQGEADAAAQADAANVMRQELTQEPCPACGALQPDVVSRIKAKRLLPPMLATLVLALFAGVYQLSNGALAPTLTLISTIAALVIALWISAAELLNASGNTKRNQEEAAARIAEGNTQVWPRQSQSPPPNALRRTRKHWLAMGCMFAAAALIAMPEAVRISRGWRVSHGTFPSVVGLGDTVRVYMGGSIVSVKGYWRGKPTVKIITKSGTTLNLESKTNENNWGDVINLKGEQATRRLEPWIELVIPNNPGLIGETLECQLSLEVALPEQVDGHTFREVGQTLDRTLELPIATANAGRTYDIFWWSGTITGFLLLIVGSVLIWIFAMNLRSKMRPGKVYL